MRFRLWVETDGEAFAYEGGRVELARLLREAAARIEKGEDIAQYKNLVDLNGNVCGGFALKERHE